MRVADRRADPGHEARVACRRYGLEVLPGRLFMDHVPITPPGLKYLRAQVKEEGFRRRCGGMDPGVMGFGT